MENIQKAYVINLKKCRKRMFNFANHMASIGISFERWEAVNGADIKKNNTNTNHICRNYTCTNGIIGCYLSHITLWKHIKQRYKEGWFLIFEDDSLITKSGVDNISNIFNEMQTWPPGYAYPEMINLGCTVLCKYKVITKNIFIPLTVNGVSCYLISVQGINNALHMLDRSINFHIDGTLFLKQLLDRKLAYYSTHNFVKYSDNFQSTISSGSFPRLEADLLNSLLDIFTEDNHLHIIYDTTILGNKITFNILLIFFIVVTSVMLSLEMYDLAVFYVLIEVVYWYFKTSISSSSC